VALATYVISGIIGLLLEQSRARSAKSDETVWTESRRVISNDQTFWAGQLSHVGVVLVVVGISFAANLSNHAEVTLEPGEETRFAGYSIVYESPFQVREPNRLVRGARVSVLEGSDFIATLEPRANFYGSDTSGVVTPAVLSRPSGDLYLTLKDIDSEEVELALDTSPLVWMIWLGGIVTAVGGAWSVRARRDDRARSRLGLPADV
jgi:cytochrome c-type biogenesis protein CcmF